MTEKKMRIVMYENSDGTWTPWLSYAVIDPTAKHGRMREATDDDLKLLGLQKLLPTCVEQPRSQHRTCIVTLPDGVEFDVSRIMYINNIVTEEPNNYGSVDLFPPVVGTYTVCLTNGKIKRFADSSVPRAELIDIWKQNT